MHRLSLAMLAVSLATGCKKEPSASRAPTGPASTKEADAMWALAPAGARGGIVVSPRALAMAETAMVTIRTAMARLPDLAPIAATIDEQLPWGPTTTLAELGLSRDKPAAMFMTTEGQVMIMPLADREKFLSRVSGTKGNDSDQVGRATCKMIKDIYACARPTELLDTLGKGDLAKHIPKAGARGDIEIVSAEMPLGPVPANAVAVIQLERGAGVLRGVLEHAPASVTSKLGAPTKPRTDPQHPGFLVLDLRPLLSKVPPLPIAADVTAADVAKTIAGPLTLTVRPGELVLDIQVPLSDPAPMKTLVDKCTELPAIGSFAKLENGACHIDVPGIGTPLAVDIWVDGKTLRVGKRNAQNVPGVAMTPTGAELANGAWSFAFWGRGTLFGPTPPMVGANAVAADAAMAIRGMVLVNELGLAATVEGDQLRFVATLRTVFANPDDVVAKILAISTEDIANGRANAPAKQIAEAAPSSPFAADYRAGNAGLMVPAAATGMLFAVAIPMFLDGMKKPRRSEAALQLDKIGKAAKAAYNTNAAFPPGEVPLTPSQPCCAENFQQRRKCDPIASRAGWQVPLWIVLDFQFDEPHFFQYGYKSDGKTFTATAVGDLDCDGITITYELRGTVDNGNVRTELIEPPPNTD